MSEVFLPTPFDRLPGSGVISITLQRDEALFTQGDESSGIYFLKSGLVDLRRTTESGHTILIHRARPGDTFAEAAMFSDTYHCTAIARSDSVAIKYKKSAIKTLLAKDIQFTSDMAARFSLQIQQSRRRIELLSIKAADERIMAALTDGLLVDDIASFAETIGLASETTYRTLAALTKCGKVIKTSRGQYRQNSADLGKTAS